MLVRYKAGKTTFEVLTKEGAAMKFRDGDLKSLDDVCVAREVFSNYSKGERASADQLKSAFDTEDLSACLEAILQKGTVQVSAAERKEKLEKKRLEIIQLLHKYYVEPKTRKPIPVTRLENALTEAKVRIDAEQAAERQVPDIVSKLVSLLPMKKLSMEVTITVPHKHLGAAGNVLAKYFEVSRENYTSEGCTMEASVVPGEYDTAVKELVKATKGEYTLDIAGQETGSASTTEEPASGKKGGKGGKKGKRK